MPVVDIERWGVALVVFMSMLSNHISWYNSRIGCGIKCDSLAPSPAVLRWDILAARQYQQVMSRGL
jgi:hypothetical protein